MNGRLPDYTREPCSPKHEPWEWPQVLPSQGSVFFFQSQRNPLSFPALGCCTSHRLGMSALLILCDSLLLLKIFFPRPEAVGSLCHSFNTTRKLLGPHQNFFYPTSSSGTETQPPRSAANAKQALLVFMVLFCVPLSGKFSCRSCSWALHSGSFSVIFTTKDLNKQNMRVLQLFWMRLRRKKG